MLKIATIIGARPQFIKAVAISRAISEFNKKLPRRRQKIKEVIIHTGQHYDYNMNDVFFEELNLKNPGYNLNVGSRSQTRQIALMLERLEAVLMKERPDAVIVYGDTNSTLAGTLAARKLNILTAHIEAGLRSYERLMPEETNRVITDRISDILFCPSRLSVANLYREGIRNYPNHRFPRVFLTGDVMYDSVLFHLRLGRKNSDILHSLNLKPRRYYLATIHRAENTDNQTRLRILLYTLNGVARDILPVVFPVHPRTKKAIVSIKMMPFVKSFRLIKPVSYLDMLILERNAKAVLTDSGGIQKEAYFLKTPCLTLRRETEWPETLRGGWNRLVDLGGDRLKRCLRAGLPKQKYNRRIYGTGRAAERIVRIIYTILTDKRETAQ